jgi:hypothetical protein
VTGAEGETAKEVENIELLLQPLKIKPEEFVGFANEYYQKLVPQLRDSFYEPETLFNLMEQGYERHYLKIVAFHEGRKMAHGLACVHIDQNHKSGHRAFLRHISVIRTELLPQALKLTVDFIWRRIQCEHIRLEQYHVANPETEKLAADESLKAALKEAKFRWQNLQNDPKTGKRSQLMQLVKPKEDAAPPFENPRGLQIGKEPIVIKAGMLIQVSDSPEEIGVTTGTQVLNLSDDQVV